MAKLIYCALVLVLSMYYSEGFSSNLPLIYGNHLEYLGAFKVQETDDFSYGGSAIAFNPANNSLYIVGHINQQKVAEISIPTPVISANLALLNRSTTIQSFVDVTEGRRELIRSDGTALNDSNGARIGGLLVHDNKLIGSSYAFYSYLGTRSHFTSGLNLATTGDVTGMHFVGSAGTPSSSFINGWMSHIPSDLQADLGGPVLLGNGCLSILGRTSYGPSAFSFDPSRLGVDSPVATTPLFYYPDTHQTLNGVNDSRDASPLFNWTTKIAGMTMVNGSRSVLYFGYHGIGPTGYGNWTSDPEKIGTDCNNDGTVCYYDPTGMGAKGPHAYPYIYQVWAYDSNDMVDVKNGTKQPWEVVPYAIWTLPFPVAPTDQYGGSAAYDPATGRLYISQPAGGRISSSMKPPLIHVFQVNINAQPASSYKIQGKAMLFNGSVVLKNNGGNSLTLTSASRSTTQDFSFSQELAPGSSYNVTVATNPDGYECSVLNGAGTVNANSNVSNVLITCDIAPNTPTLLIPTSYSIPGGVPYGIVQ